jgi:Uma2 family endonuclease
MYSLTTDEPRRHSLTVEDYYRMAEVGILGPDDRVELIEGEIIDMPPPGELHAGTVSQLDHLLQRAVGDRAIVFVQNPAVLGRYSAPQPDIALLRSRADFYKSALPRSGDILLVIEVADTSLRYDRDVKVGLYARHTIPELWLVDVRGKRLTRYRDPTAAGAYSRVDEPDLGSPVEVGGLPGVGMDLDAVFAD